MSYTLILIPFISAFIGWFTVWMGVRLLFHSGKPAGKPLFSFDEIRQKITHPDTVQQIMPMVEAHIDHFLREKLSAEMPMISMFIGEKTIQQLKGIFIAEIQTLFPDMLSQYLDKLERELDFKKILAVQLRKPLRKARIIAGLFGFAVGLLQAGLLLLWR
ncbi:MAG: hypothetical protein J0H85_14245 [Sediminibacterium magnilacihabitans]|jgi:hypothetical protein|nr:hypothetical protein [Sediminibacterium magnilacihabitans]PQV59528.1 hypothetical protein CLV53_11735 [Sediminibacterium magnilacihabitans]